MSSTALTEAYLKAKGYTVGKTEHWNSFAHRRVDLFGFIDQIAVGNGQIVGVQATTLTEKQRHLDKIYAESRAREWLKNGGKILLICWRQLLVKRGGKRKKWAPDETWITLESFPAQAN